MRVLLAGIAAHLSRLARQVALGGVGVVLVLGGLGCFAAAGWIALAALWGHLAAALILGGVCSTLGLLILLIAGRRPPPPPSPEASLPALIAAFLDGFRAAQERRADRD